MMLLPSLQSWLSNQPVCLGWKNEVEDYQYRSFDCCHCYAFILPEAYLYILGLAYIFAIMVISWDLMVGYTGQVNLGHTTFVGLGAYVAALLQTPLRAGIALHPALAIVSGGIAAAAVGLSVGVITLRLRGYYFSLVTAILPLVFMQTVFIWRELFGGEEGFAIENTMLATTVEKYYFSMVILAASFIIMKKLWTAGLD